MQPTRKVLPGPRTGIAHIPGSKSKAHRLLIMAALSDAPTTLECNGLSNDILATINCLKALGCDITTEDDSLIRVIPLSSALSGSGDNLKNSDTESTDKLTPNILPCRDSGSTLRFILPLAGVLNAQACFEMEGRLPERPLAPYDSELEAHGMKLRKDGNSLHCEGRLLPGNYTLPGNVTSQYISGLLMSLPFLGGDSTLTITGPIESSDYIHITEDVLRLAGIRFTCNNVYDGSDLVYHIPGGQRSQLPDKLSVESDWSGGAFFLCLGALSPAGITVRGLNTDSTQGDKAILDILKRFGADISIENDPADITVRHSALKGCEIDAAGYPDLVPIIGVIAAAASGTTRIINAGRLRLKESDRLKTTAEMLTVLGATVTEGEDSLTIEGRGSLKGGTIDSHDDHRIAMSAAVAASICDAPVIVTAPECVKKSFADFWEVFEELGIC
ncbi:MAG: 3-phosphoshikimate 1-carboxyvinyltransferase [Lachnospiraceae bacterium]|nr:3-phosphoshikimate 1-carboxyvinyltransferase [Lachnospiraceae bacterium]